MIKNIVCFSAMTADNSIDTLLESAINCLSCIDTNESV